MPPSAMPWKRPTTLPLPRQAGPSELSHAFSPLSDFTSHRMAWRCVPRDLPSLDRAC